MSLPTDPIFYSVAALAVILVGVAKGGFAGLGAAAMPILVLVMDPAPAAAMLLPILIAQDIVSVWAFRRDFDVATLKLMLPGGLIGVFLGWLFATAVPVDAVRALAAGGHDFKALVIDTLDHAEPLVWSHVCSAAKVDSIEAVGGGFGKGYVAADRDIFSLEEMVALARRDTTLEVSKAAWARITDSRAIADEELERERDRHGDRILEGLAGQDLGQGQAFPDHVDDTHAGRIRAAIHDRKGNYIHNA